MGIRNQFKFLRLFHLSYKQILQTYQLYKACRRNYEILPLKYNQNKATERKKHKINTGLDFAQKIVTKNQR